MTVVSNSFYKHLRDNGAPVGEIRPTNRRLRGANGSQIAILGCSLCLVAFLGLQMEFPILICDLSTDAIIGTDTLGSVLPHTLDIKNGLLFTEGGVSLQLHRRDAALSGCSRWDIVLSHHTRRRFSIAPLELWVVGLCLPVGYCFL